MEPKVLVGAPIFDGSAYAMPEYLKGIKSLAYPNVDYLLVDNSQTDAFFQRLQQEGINVVRKFHELKDPREKLVAGRNFLARKAIEENYEYFLSLEQDVIPPKDVIERLMQHKKLVISGVYYGYSKNSRGETVAMPLLYRDLTSQEKKSILQNKEKFQKMNLETFEVLQASGFDFSLVRKQMTRKEVQEKKVIAVKSCGLGCALIHRSILEQVPFRVNKSIGFDDMLFCEDLRAKNIQTYADTSVTCRHLVKQKPWKWVQFKSDKDIN